MCAIIQNAVWLFGLIIRTINKRTVIFVTMMKAIKHLQNVGAFFMGRSRMKTKYNTGDEVLIPVKIETARGTDETIMYYMSGLKNDDGDKLLVPEVMIEGLAKIGIEKGIQLYRKKFKQAIDIPIMAGDEKIDIITLDAEDVADATNPTSETQNIKTANIDMEVNRSEINKLKEELIELNELLERASSIIEKLAKEKDEIKLSVGFKF